MADVLYETKNFYYIGSYQQSVKEAQKVSAKSDAVKLERDVFLYRSYLGLGKSSVVLSEISDGEGNDALKAVRMLARYESDPNSRTKVADSADALADSTSDDLALVVLGTILLKEQRHESAFAALSRSALLEAKCLLVQNLVVLNRYDLALKTLRKMQEVDEDATLTQLALAWLYLCTGKDKLQDAFYIFQELIDKFGATANLLVSKAVTQIAKGNYKEAEESVQQAEEKDAASAAVLINQFFLGSALRKSDEVLNRSLTQLKLEHADVQWVRDYVEHEQLLDNWED